MDVHWMVKRVDSTSRISYWTIKNIEKFRLEILTKQIESWEYFKCNCHVSNDLFNLVSRTDSYSDIIHS